MGGNAVAGRMILHAVVSCAAIALVFMVSPRSFAGDTDTARNYLSTIVSCLSTIFALCISITLVAIQLTASRYTHRVLDMFLKMPFNVSLIIVYFVTIIQSLYLLSRIAEPIHETLPAYLQPQMNADMVLVIVCFAMLVLYIRAVMQLLKPERIVAAIEAEFRLSLRRRRSLEAMEKVEQVCDIAKRAAADMDSTTGMIAVEALCSMSREGTRRVRGSAVRQFIEIAAVAAKEREGGMLGSILESVRALCEDAVAHRRWKAAREAVDALERITRESLVGQQMFPSVQSTVTSLFDLEERIFRDHITNEQGRVDILQAARLSERVGTALFRIGREILVREPDGDHYVGEAILGRRLGEWLTTLARRAGVMKGREGVAAARLVLGGCRLGALLIEQGRVRDVAPLIAWLGRAVQGGLSSGPSAAHGRVASARAGGERTGGERTGGRLVRAGVVRSGPDWEVATVTAEWALAMAALLCALTSALGRADIRHLLLTTVAACGDWPSDSLRRLATDYGEVWELYDYADIGALFSECREAWEGPARSGGGLTDTHNGRQRWRALLT